MSEGGGVALKYYSYSQEGVLALIQLLYVFSSMHSCTALKICHLFKAVSLEVILQVVKCSAEFLTVSIIFKCP